MLSALFAVVLGHDAADGLHPAGHGAGVAVQGGPLPEDVGQLLGVHGGDGRGVERPLLPSRCSRSAGEEKAFSIVTCWSSTMPIRRASGSRLMTASASSSPVMWSAIRAMEQILARRPPGRKWPRAPGAGRLSPCTSRPRSTTASGPCSRWPRPGRRRRPSTWPGSRDCRPASSGRSWPTCAGPGVVASQRGAEGGYRLARDPDAITIADVIRALDGPLAEVRGYRPEATSYDGAAENLQQVWVAVRASLRSVLEKITLTDVIIGQAPAARAEARHGSGCLGRPLTARARPRSPSRSATTCGSSTWRWARWRPSSRSSVTSWSTGGPPSATPTPPTSS